MVFTIDLARCTGCQRCEANCTLANDGVAQPYMSRIHVRDYAQFGGKVTVDYLDGEGIFGNWSIPAETCRQCKDAPCMVGCPVKAISPDPRTGAHLGVGVAWPARDLPATSPPLPYSAPR